MKYRLLAVVVLAALFVADVASGKNLVREFRGTKNSTTNDFRVDGPWLLDWRLDGDYAQMIALDIWLLDARTGRPVGKVLHTQRRGNGVKLFQNGGVYKLRVSSTLAQWTIKIEQITPEEAEQYTPRGGKDKTVF